MYNKINHPAGFSKSAALLSEKLGISKSRLIAMTSGIEKDGRVTVISNDTLKYKTYGTISIFKAAYDARLCVEEFTQLFYSDNMLNRLEHPNVYMGIK